MVLGSTATLQYGTSEQWLEFWPDFSIIWESEHRAEAQSPESKAQINDSLYEAYDSIDMLRIATARVNNNLVGYVVTLFIYNVPFLGTFSAYSAFYYVRQAYRGLGVGGTLIKIAEDQAKAKGAEYFYVSAKFSLPFIGLFKHFGWEDYEATLRKKLV